MKHHVEVLVLVTVLAFPFSVLGVSCVIPPDPVHGHCNEQCTVGCTCFPCTEELGKGLVGICEKNGFCRKEDKKSWKDPASCPADGGSGGSTTTSTGGSGGTTGGSGGSPGGSGGSMGGSGGTGGITTTTTTTSSTTSSTTVTCGAGEVLCPNGDCIPCPSAPQVHLLAACSAGNTCSSACEPGWSNCDGIDINGCETQGSCPTVSCGPVELTPASGSTVCVEYDNASVTAGLYGAVSTHLNSLVNPAPPATATCVGSEPASANNSTKPQVSCSVSGLVSGGKAYLYLDMRDGGGAHVNDVCTPGNVGSPKCPVTIKFYQGVVLQGAYDPSASPQPPFAVVMGSTPMASVQMELTAP